MVNMADDLISTGQAAEMVGYTRRSITRWVREGKLVPTRRTPGGHLKWDPKDLKRQLAALEQGAHAGDGTSQE